MMVGLLPAYGTVSRQQCLCDRRNDRGLEFQEQNIKWNNINSDEMRPAKSKEIGKTDSEPAACRWPLRQVRRPYRRLYLGLRGLREIPAASEQGRKAGRTVRWFCRRSGPQGHSRHPILFHAAPAPEKSSDHGRRRDSGPHKQTLSPGWRIGRKIPILFGRCSGPNGLLSSR